MKILPFLHDPSARVLQVCGGKAAVLATLTGMGFDVPLGFVIPADIDLEDSEGRECLRRALEALGVSEGDTPLAVRSSGVGEDGAEASYAGQFETLLNIRGADSVREAVRLCRASFSSERATQYREGDVAGGGAVLVQRQVRAAWAGVAFTADPASGIRSLKVVEMVAGLGDDLVSGRVEPAYLRWDARSQLAVEERSVTSLGMGREEFYSLSRRVMAEAARVEAALGRGPLDMEWAHDGQKLWILQARPLTTPTFDLPERSPLADPDLWLHFNFAETMPGPVTELDWELLNLPKAMQFFSMGFASFARESGTAPFERVAGRVCWNGSFFLAIGVYRWPWIREWRQIDAATFALVGNLIRKRSWRLRRGPTVIQRFQALCEQAFFLARVFWQGVMILPRVLKGPGLPWQPASSPKQSEGDCGDVWNRMCEAADRMSEVLGRHLGLMAWGMFFPVIWSRAAAAASGLTVPEVLGDLAAHESGMMRLQRALRELGLKPENPEALESFMREFGHRGPGEQVLSRPRLSENPAQVRELARGACLVPAARAGDPGKILGAVRQRSWLGPFWERLLRASLPLAQRLFPVREDVKHVLVMPLFRELRKVILEAGALLVKKGALETPEDVFHLRMQEIQTLIANPISDDARHHENLSKIRERKRQLEQWAKIDFPLVMSSWGQLASDQDSAVEGTWAGQGISPGVFEGTARVATSFEEAMRLETGEVLVARAMDPGWTLVFPRAGALVMEVGGVLSHVAVVARERALPAVAGARGIVGALKTGQRIRVDGRGGVVSISDKIPQ